MAKKPVGTGSLFADRAHTAFLEFTSRQYGNMKNRMRKKLKNKDAELPFSLKDFRADILSVMDGKEDGAILCRYCNTHFTIEGIAVDHAKPLSRGGSPGLENLDYPCRPCNNRKGEMDPVEFKKLLAFLETIPLARIGVLKRLEQSVALAAGARSNAATIGELKKTGQWQAVQAARREKKKAKESGLGAF
jgi:5-methylcytosine-specific restriction endonuclease McrA